MFCGIMEIKRDIHLNRLIASRENSMIKVITGIRRCGKSYLLMTIFRNYLLAEGVESDHIITMDLENRRNIRFRDPDELLHHIDSQITDDEKYYVLLDEIQLVREFEDVLNSYLKMENVDVYVTGSNSRFLSKDVITEFRGRGEEIHITPLSFAEYISAHQEIDKRQALKEYLTFGGLPRVCIESDVRKKMEYLKSLFRKTYLTDIKERYHITDDDEMRELINVLASDIGGLTNPTRIENTFRTVKGIRMSKNTIKQYLDILEESFIISKSVRYDVKGRRYIDTPSKYYFEDLGLRNARLGFRQIEETHLMENLIYNELRLRGYEVDVGVVTYNTHNENGASIRTQLEVDFVCNKGYKKIYVQSAYRLPSPEKRDQEMASLLRIDDSFMKMIVTEDAVMKHQDENGIYWIDIYDFLASNEDEL